MTRDSTPSPTPTCLLKVRAQPNARKNELAEILTDGTLRIRLAAPPVDGKANEALAEFLAELLGVRRGALRLVRGEKSRDKIWEVQGVGEGEARKRLEGFGFRN